jgi:hypothetical protein
MKAWQKILNDIPVTDRDIRPCFCIGPQNGEPFCPCQMRNLKVYRRDAEWVIPERRIKP